MIISPDEMNAHIATIIVAPMTTKGRLYPTRIRLNFNAKEGQIILDQIRTINKKRLVKKLGIIETSIQKQILGILTEMFSE